MKRIYFNEYKAIVAEEEEQLYKIVSISEAQKEAEESKVTVQPIQALDLKEGFLIEAGYVKI